MNKIQEMIRQYAQNHEQKWMDSIIDEIQHCENLWVAYAPVTKNHYMDFHHGIPTAFLFSERSFCDGFKEYLRGKQLLIEPMECGVSERVTMFSDFFRNGIEQVIVDNGQTFIVLDLMDIIHRPDFSSVPEDERPLLNQSLMKSANYFFQCINQEQDQSERETDFMQKVYSAQYLLPLVFGDTAPRGMSIRAVDFGGTSVNLAVLRRRDGSSVIPVFTDWVELGKYDKEKQCVGNLITFDELAELCHRGELVSVNPLGFNMLMDNTTAESIRKRFVQPKEKAAGNAGQQSVDQPENKPMNQPTAPAPITEPAAAPAAEAASAVSAGAAARPQGAQIVFSEATAAPAAMIQTLKTELDHTGGIKSAYLKEMRKDGVMGYVVIVDFEGTNPAVFPRIAQKAGPLAGGAALNFVSYNSGFGRSAAGNTQPFYRRMK